MIPHLAAWRVLLGRQTGVKFLEGRILGEGGNLGVFDNPMPSRPSSGTQSSLERAFPGMSTVAMG